MLRLATLGHEGELDLHLREHAALHHLLQRHTSWHLDCLLRQLTTHVWRHLGTIWLACVAGILLRLITTRHY